MRTKTAVKPVPVSAWGKDHWSALAYIECRCVDNKGVPNRVHMRCCAVRHPGLAHLPGKCRYPTRLKGGVELDNHDDWDCVADIEAAGLVKVRGTGIDPVWKLTDKGKAVAARLRAHKAAGGVFSTFNAGTL